MEVKIATWNMCHWQKQGQSQEAWDYLDQHITADIVLVQEAFPPEDRLGANGLWEKIGGTRQWGTGIFTRNLPVEPIEIKPNSHPGAVVAANVTLPDNSTITVISLYGLFDENKYSITTLHRMLSDLTFLLDASDTKRLVLGGDFNASVQIDEQQTQKYWRLCRSHQIFFDRLEDFWLRDCCGQFHIGYVQTHRHGSSKIGWQNDYLYASVPVFEHVTECRVIDDPSVYHLSDHNPVVAVFDL